MSSANHKDDEAVHTPEETAITRPQDWSPFRKWTIVLTSTAITFMVSFGSSVYSSAMDDIAAEFGVSTSVSTLGITLYVVAFGLGPLIWGPASELYGRTRPLFLGYFLFCIWQIPLAAANNMTTVLIARFFAALFGSSTLAIVGGLYVDFLGPVERGISTGIYSVGVFCGPVLGPVMGAVIVKELGWRWTGWVTLMASSFLGILSYLCTPESSESVLRRRWEQKLGLPSQETPVNFRVFIEKYLTKPIRMLVLEPILLVFTIYMSLVYAILYLTLTMYPYAFGAIRQLSTVTATMPFLFLLAGIIIASGMMTLHSVWIGKGHAAGKPLIPEARLPPVVLGSMLLPAGLLWFAYTSDPNHFSWVLQASSGIAIGCGIILVFMLCNLFLIEVYLGDTNSALAINIAIRSALAASFPILSEPMLDRLGVRGVGEMLGYMCLGLAPFPILMILYGPRIRTWSKYAK